MKKTLAEKESKELAVRMAELAWIFGRGFNAGYIGFTPVQDKASGKPTVAMVLHGPMNEGEPENAGRPLAILDPALVAELFEPIDPQGDFGKWFADAIQARDEDYKKFCGGKIKGGLKVKSSHWTEDGELLSEDIQLPKQDGEDGEDGGYKGIHPRWKN